MTFITLEDSAKELAGNHRKFESFGWRARPENDEAWTIITMQHRDSGALQRSNFIQIQKELEGIDADEENWRVERHSDFLVGWQEAFVIQVYDADGAITSAFEKMHELQERMDDYPVLAEEHFSELESEEFDESWKLWGFDEVKRNIEKQTDIDDFDDFCKAKGKTEGEIEEALMELCHDGCQTYYHHEDSGPYIQTERLAEAIVESLEG